jgi:hypothetical protein
MPRIFDAVAAQKDKKMFKVYSGEQYYRNTEKRQ